jgi:stress response protein SCP2
LLLIIQISNQRQQATASNLHCRIEDLKENKDYGRYHLSTLLNDCTTFVYCCLARTEGGWAFKAVGRKIKFSKVC